MSDEQVRLVELEIRLLNDWAGSEEGKACRDGSASGELLMARLLAAYQAGEDAGKRIRTEELRAKALHALGLD